MKRPVSELGYTTNDDGVWITCILVEEGKDNYSGDRHWQYNLGFWPTVMDAMEVWQRHLDAVHLEVADEVRRVVRTDSP